MKSRSLFILLVTMVFISCKPKVDNYFQAPLTELTDAEYPDNTDIGYRHSLYGSLHLDKVYFIPNSDSLFNIVFTNAAQDSIIFKDITFKEWMPEASNLVRNDPYLHRIGIINQEWNRNQIQFDSSQFRTVGEKLKGIKRVDIARNCLSAYLWELILYVEESNTVLPIHHNWFNFPNDLYAILFKKYDGEDFDIYRNSLEYWIEPDHKPIEIHNLRSKLKETVVTFINHNNESYAKKGEREKKYKNIIYPKNTTRIQDFLTDSTQFATFSAPGFYNTKNPKKTELSRLANPYLLIVRKVLSSQKDTLIEIELQFAHKNPDKVTKFVLSGLVKNEIPVLDTAFTHLGWQNSMGFGNHTFYETYTHALTHPTKTSPYFCYLADSQNRWLDSHVIGIDGPLLHWDIHDSTILHLWIISFERHSLVGHYSFKVI